MANTMPSANMSLPIPVVGVDPGPDYATNQNSCFTILDAHNHTSGSGVQITPAGLNINSDLSLNINDLTLVRTVRFSAQSAVLSDAADLGCLYEVGVDLYYNDGSGNQIRLTQSGGVAGTSGSIAGLTSPASATYVGANQTFVWQSAASTPANLDAGSVIIRKIVASSNGITLSAPLALASNFTLTLPTSLPASQKFATIDASGNIASNWATDNSTLEISSNTLQIKDLGVTRPKLSALGQQLSSSSGGFTTTSTSFVDVTNLSVTITTTGRPVMLMVLGGTGSSLSVAKNGTPASCTFQILRDAVVVGQGNLSITATGATVVSHDVPTGGLNTVDVVAAGTYVYKVQAKAVTATTTVGVGAAKLLAYEL